MNTIQKLHMCTLLDNVRSSCNIYFDIILHDYCHDIVHNNFGISNISYMHDSIKKKRTELDY